MRAPRENLILSYVDRDQLTGDERDPSPVVLELLDVLQRGYLRDGATRPRRHPVDQSPSPGATGAEGGVPSIVEIVPLHRDEDARMRAAFPAAAAEAPRATLAIGCAPRSRTSRGLTRRDRARAVRATRGRRCKPDCTRSSRRRSVAGIAEAGSPSAARLPRPAAPRVLQLAERGGVLECPLQGSARVVLGLRDLPDDTDHARPPRTVRRAARTGTACWRTLHRAWSGDDPPDPAIWAAATTASHPLRWAGRALPRAFPDRRSPPAPPRPSQWRRR